jgi:hypothetical protein
MERPDAEEWRIACLDEMKSHGVNGTWELVKKPEGVKAIPLKWVFTIKRDPYGNVERYKARVVAKGFMQREGIDYNDVYAPVGKHDTLRVLLALTAARDLELHQLDIKTAFLNGDLVEDIYAEQAPGFEVGGKDTVCHLKKALYGLKQAPRAWYHKLKGVLEGMGFKQSNADPGLFTQGKGVDMVYMLVWVDDLLIAAHSLGKVQEVKGAIMGKFDARDLGEAKTFLGFEISRDRTAGTLTVTQRGMAMQLVGRYGLEGARAKVTPMAQGVVLTRGGDEPMVDVRQYRELLGSLLYLSGCTRPDISYSVGALSRYMAEPHQSHWLALKGVLAYIASTSGMGLVYGREKGGLVGFCDADYAGDVDTRRSTTGYVFLLAGAVISWQSRLQQTVAVSTAEAEYMASSSAVKEALWLRVLWQDLGFGQIEVPIFGDNQAAIRLTEEAMSSARAKHIDVQHHFVRQRVRMGQVRFTYVSTDRMVADIMTKALVPAKHITCRELMGMRM